FFSSFTSLHSVWSSKIRFETRDKPAELSDSRRRSSVFCRSWFTFELDQRDCGIIPEGSKPRPTGAYHDARPSETRFLVRTARVEPARTGRAVFDQPVDISLYAPRPTINAIHRFALLGGKVPIRASLKQLGHAQHRLQRCLYFVAGVHDEL